MGKNSDKIWSIKMGHTKKWNRSVFNEFEMKFNLLFTILAVHQLWIVRADKHDETYEEIEEKLNEGVIVFERDPEPADVNPIYRAEKKDDNFGIIHLRPNKNLLPRVEEDPIYGTIQYYPKQHSGRSKEDDEFVSGEFRHIGCMSSKGTHRPCPYSNKDECDKFCEDVVDVKHLCLNVEPHQKCPFSDIIHCVYYCGKLEKQYL